MTVQELIKELSALPPELTVVCDGEDAEVDYVQLCRLEGGDLHVLLC